MLPLTSASILDFRFDDGRSIYTPANAVRLGANLIFATGSTGEITGWQVAIQAQSVLGLSLLTMFKGERGPGFDAVQIDATTPAGFAQDFALAFRTGSWTLTTNAIPEPTTLALMALGVAGLGYRRRKT